MRVVAGYLKISYVGRLEDFAGVLKVSMGFKSFSEGFTAAS